MVNQTNTIRMKENNKELNEAAKEIEAVEVEAAPADFDPMVRPIWEFDPYAINPFEELPPKDAEVGSKEQKGYTLTELLGRDEDQDVETMISDKCPGDWDKPTPLVSIFESAEDETSINIILRVGDWYVSDDGDMLFNRKGGDEQTLKNLNYYPIYSHQLEDNDWVLHLAGKAWFDTKAYEDFKRAYFIACSIANVTPTLQVRSY